MGQAANSRRIRISRKRSDAGPDHRLRFAPLLSPGMPMQVVVPSVSRAETLQGAVFTGARGTSCSGSGAGIGGWLAGGAMPTVDGT
jgi:hypothetical protein